VALQAVVVGAGYDSSGRELTDRRWIYEYDAGATATAARRRFVQADVGDQR